MHGDSEIRTSRRLVIDLDSDAEPISGRITADDAAPVTFAGYIQLVRWVEAARRAAASSAN
jgi:hypothetical protein